MPETYQLIIITAHTVFEVLEFSFDYVYRMTYSCDDIRSL